jgi:hypothetical protein
MASWLESYLRLRDRGAGLRGANVARAVLCGVGAHLRRRIEWYLVPLFFAALVGIQYGAIWQGKLGIGWDLIESYWADLAFLANELRRGNFPLWNPYERLGYPAHADPQPALFYPVQWLFALWGAWRGETSWLLIQVKELVHHALVGVLLHLFLRGRGLSWQAALLAGTATVLSGAWLVNKSHNYVQAIAWLPLVWIAVDRVLARPSWRSGCALAAALYLPASAGSPPGLFYVVLGAVLYGAFRALPWLAARALLLAPWRRAVAKASRREARREARRDLLRLSVALTSALALTAATQLIMHWPTFQLLALTPRANRTLAFALSGECGAQAQLFAVLLPSKAWFGPNAGLVTLVLALLALARRPHRDSFAPLFFMVGATFFLVLSIAGATPVLGWLVTHVPGFGMFRVSCRYMMLWALFLACAGAYGLDTALARGGRWWPRVLAPALITCALLVLVPWQMRLLPHAQNDPAYPLRPWLLVALSLAVVWATSLLPGRAARLVAVLAPLLVIYDTTQLGRRDMGLQPRPDNLEDRAKLAELPGLDRYRVYDEFLLEQRAGSRLGLREVRGYTSGDPLAFEDYGATIAASLRNPALLAEYNVRYVFHGPHSTKGWYNNLLVAAPDRASPGRFRRRAPAVYEALHPAPQLAWYEDVRLVPRGEVLPTLAALREATGVRRSAVIAADEPARAGLADEIAALSGRAGGSPRPAVEGQVTHFSSERIEGRIVAPGPGLVVLNEVAYPGWRVRVDGIERKPIRVDLLLRGVLVPAGAHRLEWSYEPPRWPLLLALWLAGMLVMLASALWRPCGRMAARRRARPGEQTPADEAVAASPPDG